MVDKTLILRKLSELEQYLLQINEFSDITIAEYSSNWKTQRIVDRTLQMMIETSPAITGCQFDLNFPLRNSDQELSVLCELCEI